MFLLHNYIITLLNQHSLSRSNSRDAVLQKFVTHQCTIMSDCVKETSGCSSYKKRLAAALSTNLKSIFKLFPIFATACISPIVKHKTACQQRDRFHSQFSSVSTRRPKIQPEACSRLPAKPRSGYLCRPFLWRHHSLTSGQFENIYSQFALNELQRVLVNFFLFSSLCYHPI